MIQKLSHKRFTQNALKYSARLLTKKVYAKPSLVNPYGIKFQIQYIKLEHYYYYRFHNDYYNMMANDMELACEYAIDKENTTTQDAFERRFNKYLNNQIIRKKLEILSLP